jgi:nucleotidyltransferase/DNA polymerase involved in DNA repair
VIAKIASNEHKPDGLTVVREDEAEAFLEPLPVLDRRENPHRKALRPSASGIQREAPHLLF